MHKKNIILVCVCLILFNAYLFAQGNTDCETCHGKEGTAKQKINFGKFQKSIHGLHLCTSCHTDILKLPHSKKLKPVSCSQCHRLESQIYLNSTHGKAIADGIKEAASCESCHGEPHELLNSRNESSTVNRKNIPKTCGTCHENEEKMKQFKLSQQTPMKTYSLSVHGKAVEKHNIGAAVCSDCHGTHDLHAPTEADSKLFKFNVPKTCSKCHENVYITYKMSIHGKAIEAKKKEAPVCTDCHGEHKILAYKDPDSSVYSSAISDKTCAPCHASERLATKYELAPDRVDTYNKSYHGIASKEGSIIVANCASCHGFHDILPSSDSKSSTNSSNIKKTCSKCHPKDSFKEKNVHERLSKQKK